MRVALLVLCFAAGCERTPARTIDVATTTSVQNSGLLDRLLPIFERTSGISVRTHATGSGRALQMLSDGSVDAVISHAPEAEQRQLESHSDWSYRKIAHNWFVIVGPPDDPARVSTATGAAQAFQRIADSQAVFVSRGDESGTHERERMLWRVAARQPPSERLITSGRGMALTLRHADESRGYTLSDAPTFWQLASSLELRILFEHDHLLLNTYAVIDHPGSADAEILASWLISPEGKQAMASFRVEDKPAYEPWPDGCSGDRPNSEPCLGPPYKPLGRR